MGKGQIVSGGTNGQYQVKIIYAYRSRVEAKITQLQQDKTAVDARITALDALIAAETDQKKREALVLERSVLRLQSASIQKQVEYYQNGMPADPTQTAWCADLTEDLTGYVGTIEIPGEDALVLIRPGYSGRATYTAARDGQLMPAIAGSANQVLFNWMILPGWQRHKPIYRAGTIVPDSLDFDANTCSVCLDAAYSSQQSLPATDGAGVTDCDMGDDPQAEYLTAAGEDFCSRNPGHPFCTQGEGSEILLTDAMLAQLREANLYVNYAHGRANDKSGVAVGDQWDVMSAGQSGDCEDFALTKMQRLVDNYGWNPDNLKLVTAYAKNGEYHAMLGVRTTNRGLVVLDVNYNEVMESARVPYRLDKIALASDTWANYSRRLDSVTIEYMQCNAEAFADGDRVVVEFTGQSWASPKVVGFIESPQPCGFGTVFVMGNTGGGEYDWSLRKYSVEANAWNLAYDIPGPEITIYGHIGRGYLFSTASVGAIFIFGGYAPFWNHDMGNDEILDRADKMDKTSESWSSIQSMLHHRAFGQGAFISGKSYIWGGSDLRDGWPDNSVLCNRNYIPTGTNYYTSNHEYSSMTDSWSTKLSVNIGRHMDRSFVIGTTGYRMSGESNLYDISPRYGCLWPAEPALTKNHRGYSPATDSWANCQDMLRGRSAHGARNFYGHGYIGNGATDVEATGDTVAIIGWTDVQIDGEWVTEPIMGWTTRWIEKYDATADSWSQWKNDLLGTYYLGLVSGNFVGSQGSTFGFGHNEQWKKIDVLAETIEEKLDVTEVPNRRMTTAESK